jgi:hypothetical protein
MCGVLSSWSVCVRVKELNCCNIIHLRAGDHWTLDTDLLSYRNPSENWICFVWSRWTRRLGCCCCANSPVHSTVCWSSRCERAAALHCLNPSPIFQGNYSSVKRYHRRTVWIQSHASIAFSSTVFELEQWQGWLRRRCQHIKMIYAFYLFNRDGIFLYSEEWNRYFLLRNRT